jgi:hypothetical protein
MRHGGVALLAVVAMLTAAENVRAQDAPVAPAPPAALPASTAPAASPAAPASTSSSDAPTDTKLQVAARIGFSVPFGSSQITEVVAGAMPFWIEGAYRLLPQLLIGVYARGSVGFTTSSCTQSCNGYLLGFGGELHYQFGRVAGFDPWIGAGGGFELTQFGTGNGSSSSGPELFNAQIGFDYQGGFGPYVGFQYDQYSSQGQSVDAEWVGAGVRGVYDW